MHCITPTPTRPPYGLMGLRAALWAVFYTNLHHFYNGDTLKRYIKKTNKIKPTTTRKADAKRAQSGRKTKTHKIKPTTTRKAGAK